MARPGLLIILLVALVALSDMVVGLWEYRDAPGDVKLAVVLGGAGMAALAVLGLGMLRRR